MAERLTPLHTPEEPSRPVGGAAGADGPCPIPEVECFTLGPFATNCYLVRVPTGQDAARGECWIVDAGFNPGVMIERARSLGLTPSMVLLTHAHIDHIAGLNEIRAAFPGAPVLIHEDEASFLADPSLNLSGGYGLPFSTRGPDRLLRDGERLLLSGTEWRVLHTPGHSPGGVTLWCESARLALVGDTLFAGSIGRFDFPTSDEEALYRSIRERLYTLPDEARVLPGHGPETTIGREKRSNPFVRGA
jgi:hydroxyacylglutathione hydrolase